MKAKKKLIIITASVLAVILTLGIIFALISFSALRPYDDFETAFIFTPDGQEVQITNLAAMEDWQVELDTMLRRGLRGTRYNLLHAIFEGRAGSTRQIVYDEDGEAARLYRADRGNLTAYDQTFMLELRFAEFDFNNPRYFYAGDERVYYDTVIVMVPDSSNEIIWIEYFAFVRGWWERDVSPGYTPEPDSRIPHPDHYSIPALRIRAVTSRLHRAMVNIVQEWRQPTTT